MSKALPLLSILLAWPSTAAAGPWTKDLGQAYLKLSEGLFLSSSFVDRNGQVQEGTEFVGATTALYAEVGLFDNLHAQLYLPYAVFRNSFDNGDETMTLGGADSTIGLQWSSGLLPIKEALRAELKIPLYDVADPVGPERNRFPQRGDGQVDATLWLSVGDSIPGLPLYAFAEVGHRFRTELFIGTGAPREFADTFVFFTSAGVTPIRELTVAANLQGAVPYTSDNLTKGYVTAGGSVFAPVFGSLALEAAFDWIAWARNSSTGVSVSFGVSYSL